MNHDLLIATLEAYGFSRGALQLIHSYLNGRKQRVKVNGSFSTWIETSVGVPQGSVLGPLLFNIYLNDLFMFVTDCKICNYADDTTIYVCDGNHGNVINKLERETLILSEWFQNNHMKLNGDKCHLMIFGEKSNDLSIKIGSTTIIESTEENCWVLLWTNNFLSRHTYNRYARKQAKSFTLFRVFPTYLTLKNSSISCGLLSYPSLATAP